MRHILGWACLVILIACCRPAPGDEKKPDKKSEKTEKQQPKEKLVPIGALVGKIARIEGAQKYITVQISQPVLQFTGRGFRVTEATRDVELQPGDEMKVRTLQPPVDFDEKGKPKRYTAKELKELKGDDPKLPGYTADFDSLKPDQIVKVYLATRKEVGKPAAKPKPRKKDKDKDAEDAAGDNKPEITMLVILGEPKK